tara:strand:+ start:1458 stop:1739 length:282 start_codon:yes stop_codon:yes gene_type:complete
LNTAGIRFNKALWHAGVIDYHDLHSATGSLAAVAISCGGHIEFLYFRVCKSLSFLLLVSGVRAVIILYGPHPQETVWSNANTGHQQGHVGILA